MAASASEAASIGSAPGPETDPSLRSAVPQVTAASPSHKGVAAVASRRVGVVSHSSACSSAKALACTRLRLRGELPNGGRHEASASDGPAESEREGLRAEWRGAELTREEVCAAGADEVTPSRPMETATGDSRGTVTGQ